jgi:hypothetical protein
VRSIPRPRLGPRQVKIRVRNASVNGKADLGQWSGKLSARRHYQASFQGRDRRGAGDITGAKRGNGVRCRTKPWPRSTEVPARSSADAALTS